MGRACAVCPHFAHKILNRAITTAADDLTDGVMGKRWFTEDGTIDLNVWWWKCLSRGSFPVRRAKHDIVKAAEAVLRSPVKLTGGALDGLHILVLLMATLCAWP